MKAELLFQDIGAAGVNNGDLKKTRARLDASKSWKKQRIVVLIPTSDTVDSKVVLTWLNLAYPPNNAVARILAKGMEVGEAYSTALDQVLSHPELSQWEYVLTLEHDNMPPPDGVLRLVERMEANPRFAAIGGLYYTKGLGGVAQIWGDPKDPVLNFRPQLPSPNGGLVECCGTGMGFTLYRLAIFKDKRLRKPWFVTQKHDGVATQDLYFWMDARKHGFRCAIDCSVKVGHYERETDTVW